MSSLNRNIVFALAAVTWSLIVHADQWVSAPPLEKAFYGGRIQVSVRLHKDGETHPHAEVKRNENGALVKLCTGALVNEMRPVDVYASRDGKALVTTDEWAHSGYEHALVFYRCDNALALKKEYSLEGFLSSGL